MSVASIQPIRLSENWISENGTWLVTKLFPVMLTTFVVPASYCEPAFIFTYVYLYLCWYLRCRSFFVHTHQFSVVVSLVIAVSLSMAESAERYSLCLYVSGKLSHEHSVQYLHTANICLHGILYRSQSLQLHCGILTSTLWVLPEVWEWTLCDMADLCRDTLD